MNFKKTAMLILLLEIAMVVFVSFEYGFTADALQVLSRYSGRLSLAVFSIIFLMLPNQAASLSRILSTRPFHVFALAHGIHLIILISYNFMTSNELNPIRLAGGFIVYAIIFAMPAIHLRQESGSLSLPQFKIYLSLYLYITWFAFFIYYLPRVQGKVIQVGGQYWEYVILLSWICMMMGMKLPVIFFRPKTSDRNH
ncbi:MAG: hypothetical protein MUE95_08910 [Cyclobacteriaceae bacterium]|jgi:hypothetical protein|nr:hypothetical protein [Cyclobacteriaceae bacterium]